MSTTIRHCGGVPRGGRSDRDGRVPPGSPVNDRASRSPRGGRGADRRDRSPGRPCRALGSCDATRESSRARMASRSGRLASSGSSRLQGRDGGRQRLLSRFAVVVHAAPASTRIGSCLRLPAEYSHCGSRGACLSWLRPSGPCVPVCAGTGSRLCTAGREGPRRSCYFRNGMVFSSEAWGYSTTVYLERGARLPLSFPGVQWPVRRQKLPMVGLAASLAFVECRG